MSKKTQKCIVVNIDALNIYVIYVERESKLPMIWIAFVGKEWIIELNLYIKTKKPLYL